MCGVECVWFVSGSLCEVAFFSFFFCAFLRVVMCLCVLCMMYRVALPSLFVVVCRCVFGCVLLKCNARLL